MSSEKFGERLALMLSQDNPTFANWDQDASAIEARYHVQDPTTVATELAEAAEAMAVGFESVGTDQWQRRGRRSDGANFTIATFSRYLIHDPIHHIYDATGERYAAGS